MPALDLIAGPLWEKWAMVLVHFLWQASLIAMLATAALHALRRKPAAQRYAVCLAAMLAIALCPAVTFFFVQPLPVDAAKTHAVAAPSQGDSPMTAREAPAAGVEHAVSQVTQESDGTDASREAADLHRASAPSEASASSHSPNAFGVSAKQSQPLAALVRSDASDESRQFMLSIYASAQPWIILAWQLGVMLLSGRLLIQYHQARSLRLTGRPAPRAVRSLVVTLARKLGMSRIPDVKCSNSIDQPTALGLLKPMILLPASWITQLPPDMLTTLLVHELAHIRRHDLWINLLQRVLEIVFFFHPAVWWLSSRTRIERELCCDETVVAVTRDRLAYATTLEFAARQRLALVGPALGAQIGGSSMSLLHRIQHVLGVAPTGAPRRNWLSGALALTVPVVIAGASLNLAPAASVIGPTAAFAEEDESDNDDLPAPRERAQREQEGRRGGFTIAGEEDEQDDDVLVLRDGKKREGEEEDDDDDDKPAVKKERGENRKHDDDDDDDDDKPRREEPRPKGDREVERPRPPREADRRPEGDRPRPEARDGDRRPEGERPLPPREGDRRPEGERPLPPPREGDRRPEGERARLEAPRGEVAELTNLVREMRREIEQLRREIAELRAARGEGRPPQAREGERREGDRPRPDAERRGEGDRPLPPPPREGERREGDRAREGDRPRPPREGDR